MVIVTIPGGYLHERMYTLEVVLKTFLGLDFEAKITYGQSYSFSMTESREKLFVEDSLFQTSHADWLEPSSLPQQPLKTWQPKNNGKWKNLSENDIPIMYGRTNDQQEVFWKCDQSAYLTLDIFGSVFFMLTRYEEYVKSDRDRFDRFPATASLAYQEGFLHRAIVNEYVEILWACLKELWPNLERKAHSFKTIVSHDVDSPYQYAFGNIPLITRSVVGDLIKRQSIKQGIARVQTWKQAKRSNWILDPFNTFDWLMELSESYDLKSAFYFITDKTDPAKDGDYDIQHPLIRNLLKRIYERGHEIGLHPSFNTYRNSQQTKKEFDLLRRICSEEGVEQEAWGGRQHFLRWESPTTFQNWNDAGLNYDSTLAFADHSGFRCGTCYEYPVFNLKTRRILDVVERPLVVMECSVLDERYMSLNRNLEEAYSYISDLKRTCRLFGGNFTLLWHNHRFVNPLECELYKQVLRS